MAESKTTIANMAVGHLGISDVINNVDTEKNSKPASQVRLWYDLSLEEVLAAYNWSLARRRAFLALDSDAAPTDWAYRYKYPSEALVIRRLVNPLGKKVPAIPFEVELSEDGSRKTIVTNLAEAEAVFTFRQNNPMLFTPYFSLTLSMSLASKLATPLRVKANIKARVDKDLKTLLAQAAAFDASEGMEDTPREAEWIAGRN